jgi:hypothetical protein
MLRTHRSLEASCATLWWRRWKFFLHFHFNGAPVEWNWQRKVLGEKPVSVPLCPPWTNSGSNPGLRGERPGTHRLSHGTAFSDVYCTCNVNHIKGKYFVRRINYNNVARIPSPFMWHRIVWYKLTDASKGCNVSIIRAISFILMIQAAHPSETSVYFWQTTRSHIPKDGNPHRHIQQNLKSHASSWTCGIWRHDIPCMVTKASE